MKTFMILPSGFVLKVNSRVKKKSKSFKKNYLKAIKYFVLSR